MYRCHGRYEQRSHPASDPEDPTGMLKSSADDGAARADVRIHQICRFRHRFQVPRQVVVNPPKSCRHPRQGPELPRFGEAAHQTRNGTVPRIHAEYLSGAQPSRLCCRARQPRVPVHATDERSRHFFNTAVKFLLGWPVMNVDEPLEPNSSIFR